MLIGVTTKGLTRGEAITLCLRAYPVYSWKRKIAFFWNLLALMLVPNQDIRQLPTGFLTSLGSVDGTIGTGTIPHKLFVLRHKFKEKARLYSFIDHEGRFPGAFVKTAFSPPGIKALEQEQKALEILKGSAGFTVPKILWEVGEGDEKSLIVQAAPEEYTALQKGKHPWPEKLLHSLIIIQGDHSSSPQACSWWAHCTARLNKQQQDWLTHTLGKEDRSLPTCFAHGDVGSENILISSAGEYFIIDWECWATDAPRRADALAYWLGRHNHTIRRKDATPVEITALYKENFLRQHKVDETEALFALAFMVARGFDLAHIVFHALYHCSESR